MDGSDEQDCNFALPASNYAKQIQPYGKPLKVHVNLTITALR